MSVDKVRLDGITSPYRYTDLLKGYEQVSYFYTPFFFVSRWLMTDWRGDKHSAMSVMPLGDGPRWVGITFTS